MVGLEGVAAAVILRWGSYLAVLLDHDKPIWPEVHSPRTSRISDEEMARINIEASAALAEWIDLPDGPGWTALRAAREPGRRLPPDAEEDVEAQGHRVWCRRAARDGEARGRGGRRHVGAMPTDFYRKAKLDASPAAFPRRRSSPTTAKRHASIRHLNPSLEVHRRDEHVDHRGTRGRPHHPGGSAGRRSPSKPDFSSALTPRAFD